MKKENIITILIIIAVITLALYIIYKPSNGATKGIAKCIGEKSVLYTQIGCPACEKQEKMFEENYKYLNVVDCFYEREKCVQAEIKATPTWEINKNLYEGVQSIEKLKELTGC